SPRRDHRARDRNSSRRRSHALPTTCVLGRPETPCPETPCPETPSCALPAAPLHGSRPTALEGLVHRTRQPRTRETSLRGGTRSVGPSSRTPPWLRAELANKSRMHAADDDMATNRGTS